MGRGVFAREWTRASEAEVRLPTYAKLDGYNEPMCLPIRLYPSATSVSESIGLSGRATASVRNIYYGIKQPYCATMPMQLQYHHLSRGVCCNDR